MNNEITQWLAHIQALKQQLADSISDRNAAYESADNWRQLYTNEAQQRRREARLAQQQLETLKAEIQQLQGESAHWQANGLEDVSAIEQEVGQLQTVEALTAKLTEVLIERDRLLDALKTEKANHEQTRKSLTAVIGDTIDQLAKERGTSTNQLSLESQNVSN